MTLVEGDHDPLTAETLPAGTTVGRYVIARRIGAGGMAAVYEGRHTDLEKRVAIKVLHRRYATHEPFVERFLLEARAASRLRHPHVVSVSDVGRDGGVPYMVMDLLEGEDLAHRLERTGAFRIDHLVDTMLPVMSAVAAAHAAGIVHRDLKPENVFLARNHRGAEHPVLLDFGISKVSGLPRVTALTSAGQLFGTPYYMSPEHVHGVDRIDARSDQYALGVILYECATAVLPFRSGSSLYALMAEIVAGRPEPPSRHRPALPGGFEAAVLRAMHVAPGSRYPTVTALGRALFPFATSAGQAAWASEFGQSRDTVPALASDGVRMAAAAVAAEAAAARVTASTVFASGPPPAEPVVVTPRELRAIEALEECSVAELEMFAVVAPAHRYRAGAALCWQGAQGDSCFLVLSGELEVVRSADGGDRVINTLAAGDVVGQLALVDRAPRSASVVARSDSIVVELGRDVFERLLAARSEIALRFQEQVAVAGMRQLRTATYRLAALLPSRVRRPSGPAPRAAMDDGARGQRHGTGR